MINKAIVIFLFATVAGFSAAENQNNLLQLVQDQLDPVQQAQLAQVMSSQDENGDREKRLILLKKIGLKASLLDFVFGKIDSFIDSKTRFINELDKQNVIKNEKYFGITTPPRSYYNSNNNLSKQKKKPTDPPPVNFDVNAPVNFVIPDQLYGRSFTLVTNASKIIGNVIYNTADRAQELAERVNAKLKHKFGFAQKLIKIGDDDDDKS